MSIGTKPKILVQCFFTPYYSPGFGENAVHGQGWIRPYELAKDHIVLPPPSSHNDTIPETFQYVPGKVYNPENLVAPYEDADNRLSLDIEYCKISKHLLAGSTCKLIMTTRHDRDIYEIVDNAEHFTGSGTEYYGHAMPRFKYPYRAWSINLKGKDDATFLELNKFTGMLADLPLITYSDLKDNTGDGLWRFEFDFESFDAGVLRKNKWNALYYHRLMATVDSHFQAINPNKYYISFKSSDPLTFNQAIAMVVNDWACACAPSTDFPTTNFSGTIAPFHWYDYDHSPFNLPIGTGDSPDATGNLLDGTSITFHNDSKIVNGIATTFRSQATPKHMIRLSGGIWYEVDEVASDTELVLTKSYVGGANDTGAGYVKPMHDVVDTWGKSTWEILSALFDKMGTAEGYGLKYIPILLTTGEVNWTFGGFDKFAVPLEDFRDEVVYINPDHPGLQRFYNMGHSNPYDITYNLDHLGNGVIVGMPFNEIKYEFELIDPSFTTIPGTVTFTQDQRGVVGDSNTLFTLLKPGYKIKLSDGVVAHTIAYVIKNDALVLTDSFAGTTHTDEPNSTLVQVGAYPNLAYYYQFRLWKWSGSVWESVYSYPTGADALENYERVAYDPTNLLNSKTIKIPLQTDITSYYTWTVTLVPDYLGELNIQISGAGGVAYSPPSNFLQKSSSRTDTTKIRTFIPGQGFCQERGAYTLVDIDQKGAGKLGCHDGGYSTGGEGGNETCVDYKEWIACYPDPRLTEYLTGELGFSGVYVYGTGTKFTNELQPGYRVQVNSTGTMYIVKKIYSDTKLELTTNSGSLNGDPGLSIRREGVPGQYGLICDMENPLDTKTLSNEGIWNTRCRVKCKAKYECHFNADFSVRTPIQFTLTFQDGYLLYDLVGEYVQIYENITGELITGLIIEVSHIYDKSGLTTIMEGMRV